LVHRDEHGLETLAKGEDGWCAALEPDTFRRPLHDQRPEIYRKYAMGSPGYRDERWKWRRSRIPTPVRLRP